MAFYNFRAMIQGFAGAMRREHPLNLIQVPPAGARASREGFGMFIFKWIGGLFTGFLGLFAPMFGAVKGIGKPGGAMRWVLHALLFIGLVGLLGYIQYRFAIGRYVSAPHPVLRQFWLPLLGVLAYANIWMLWLVWRLYDPKPGPSPWPDIDFTWDLVEGAIVRSGIDPARVPLFLVLGRPSAGFGVLFDAGRVPIDVNGVPESQLAPLQVYAGKQAIFIVSADTCLIGAFADRLSAQANLIDTTRFSNIDMAATLAAQSAREGAERPAGASGAPAAAGSSKAMPALSPDGPSKAMPALAPGAKAPEGSEPAPPGEGIPEMVSVITRDPELLARMRSRLDHLCRLVRGLRHPWCPLNGVILVLPELVTADNRLATQAAILTQRDLATVIESSGVECPAVVMFSDAEKIIGFREFLSLIPRDKRDQRLGKPIPLALGLPAEKRAEIMRRSIYWQCAELIPKLVTRTFQIRSPEANPARAAGNLEARANRQLIRLIGTMWARRRNMGELCARILGENAGSPLRVGGCYFAATGPNRNSQGFLAELFAQVFEGQNFVSWTAQAAREEKSLMRVVYAGYAVTGLVVASTLAMLVAVLRLPG